MEKEQLLYVSLDDNGKLNKKEKYLFMQDFSLLTRKN